MKKLIILSLVLILSVSLFSGLVLGSECTDSDGGVNYYQTGICTDSTGTYQDECFIGAGGSAHSRIREYRCVDNLCSVGTMNDTFCPYDFPICSGGICIQEPSDNLILNGDFSDGTDNWEEYHNTQVSDEVYLAVNMKDIYHTVLNFSRYTSVADGGCYGLKQVRTVDVSNYDSLYLEGDVKLVSYTLEGSGSWSEGDDRKTGEYPINLVAYYTDKNGNRQIWKRGFLKKENIYSKTNYDVAPLGEWYHFKSENLMQISPKPVEIVEIQIGGCGWSFSGKADNLKLYGTESEQNICGNGICDAPKEVLITTEGAVSLNSYTVELVAVGFISSAKAATLKVTGETLPAEGEFLQIKEYSEKVLSDGSIISMKSIYATNKTGAVDSAVVQMGNENIENCPEDCTPEVEENSCVDSDGGLDYYTKGTVTEVLGGEVSTGVDYCNDKNTLVEWTCMGIDDYYYKVRTNHTCSDGCSNGACILKKTVCGDNICEASEMTTVTTETPVIITYDENVFTVELVAVGTIGSTPAVTLRVNGEQMQLKKLGERTIVYPYRIAVYDIFSPSKSGAIESAKVQIGKETVISCSDDCIYESKSEEDVVPQEGCFGEICTKNEICSVELQKCISVKTKDEVNPSELIDIALKLEVVGMKFNNLAAQTEMLGDYYSDYGEDEKAELWYQASNVAEETLSDINDLKLKLKMHANSMTDEKYEEIVTGVKNLRENLNKILNIILEAL